MAYKAPIWENGKSPAISAENLNNLSQAAEGAQVLYGNSAPTSSTEGAVGQFYLVVVADSDGNYPLYQCVAIANGRYTWRDTRRIPDSITSMLGIPAPGTINRALNVLANVGNLHVWEKCLYSYSVENSQNKTIVRLTTKTDYQYSSSVKGGPNGTELVEPQTFTTPSAYGDISTLRNKYILNPSDGKIYLWTSSNSDSSGWYYDCTEIITVSTLESTAYLTSTDPDAYTDGTVDGTTITYLGQLGEPSAKIEVVTYVGTGTYGKDNPCSVTLDFSPKLVFRTYQISGEISALYGVTCASYSLAVLPADDTYYPTKFPVNESTSLTKKSLDGKTISWYDTKYDSYQLNYAGSYNMLVFVG